MESKIKLETEKEHIKIAVDLILILEQNNINPETALKAIEIVKQNPNLAKAFEEDLKYKKKTDLKFKRQGTTTFLQFRRISTQRRDI